MQSSNTARERALDEHLDWFDNYLMDLRSFVADRCQFPHHDGVLIARKVQKQVGVAMLKLGKSYNDDWTAW